MITFEVLWLSVLSAALGYLVFRQRGFEGGVEDALGEVEDIGVKAGKLAADLRTEVHDWSHRVEEGLQDGVFRDNLLAAHVKCDLVKSRYQILPRGDEGSPKGAE